MDEIDKILEKVEARSTEERHESLLDIRILRVTSAEILEKCPTRWRMELPVNKVKTELQIENIPDNKPAKRDYGKVGTLVHLLAEQHLDRICAPSDDDESFLTDEELALVAMGLGRVLPINEIKNWRKYQTRLAAKFAGCSILSKEKRYEIPADISYRVTGGIDCVIKDNEGNVWVVDHKTERKPHTKGYWKTKLQIVSYAAAIGTLYNVEKVGIFVGMVNTGDDMDFFLNTAQCAASVKRRYASIEKDIKSGATRLSGGSQCTYCIVKETCPNKRDVPSILSLLGEN